MEKISSMGYCFGEVPSFFLFNFSTPPKLFLYSYVPTLFLLVTFLFLFFSFNKEKRNFSLVPFLVFSIFWMLNETVQWLSSYNYIIWVSWHLTEFFQTLVIASGSIFVIEYLNGKNESAVISKYWPLYIPSLVIAVLAVSTNYVVDGYNFAVCEGVNGIVWPAVYIFSLLLFVYHVYKIVVEWFEKHSFSSNLNFLLCYALFTLAYSIPLFLGDLNSFYDVNIFTPIGYVVLTLFLFYAWISGDFLNKKISPVIVFILVLVTLLLGLLVLGDLNILRIIIILTLPPVYVMGRYLVKTENIIKNKNEQLIQLDQQKNEFLSFATHQLKSPLTAMKWGMETLKDMDAVTSEDEVAQRKSIVSKLYDTTNDLIRTVTDLLDISKIEQGGLVLKIENFDWVAFTKRISEEFRMAAQLKGLVLRVDMPDEVITVSGDQTKLRQVVVNIVDNAIKYTPTGTVSVSVIRDGGNVLVKVSDTGPGIEPEEIDKLFNKFSRGAAGKGSGNAGSGLGLYLVKKIMELHHGDVWAESAGIGTGSQFYIKLPILSEAADKIIQ